ncbi:hypothetical protein EON68_00405 [archaeon]|nr:MAG: hypothetical protein EON68_00405 [archaeon]
MARPQCLQPATISAHASSSPPATDVVDPCMVRADELIRQVTINAPERGLLLLRVRDEIRMTLDAYKTLYNSSVTFGIRKQMQAEIGIPEMEAQILVRTAGRARAHALLPCCAAHEPCACLPCMCAHSPRAGVVGAQEDIRGTNSGAAQQD